MKFLSKDYDEKILESIQKDAKLIIDNEEYQFLITPHDFFIKGNNLFSLKEVKPILFSYQILNKTKEQSTKSIKFDDRIYHCVAFTTFIDLRKYVYEESLNLYYLYFKKESSAISALTIFERFRYANWDFEKYQKLFNS